MRAMNADDIIRKLQKVDTVAELDLLYRAADVRRGEVNLRLSEINDPPPPFATPVARQAAKNTSMEAIAGLDREGDDLMRELRALESLQMDVVRKTETVRAAAIRAAAPKARRNLAAASQRVRKALAALDEAIAELGATLTPVSELASLPGEKFPLDDEEAGALLELRNAVWKVRTLPTLIVPLSGKDFPRSFAAAFETTGGPADVRIRPRQAPHTVWLPDVGQATTVHGGRF